MVAALQDYGVDNDTLPRLSDINVNRSARELLRAAAANSEDLAHAALLAAVAFARDPSLGEAYRNETATPQVREWSLRSNEKLRDYRYAAHVEAARAAAGQAPERVLRFLKDFHGLQRAPRAHPKQQPGWLFFPGIRAQPWFEPLDFPWTTGVAQRWESVANDYRGLMESEARAGPYMRSDMGLPSSWNHLADQMTWSAFHLYRGGQPDGQLLTQCDATMSALRDVPLARAQGHAPEVFFSVLQPGIHIPPHVGLTNAKLTVHLPLWIPDNCGIRVGGETRRWRIGECLIFDDSFEHEAWNRSAEPRVVLIFEIWHPDLTAPEIRALQAIIACTDDWNRRVAELASPI